MAGQLESYAVADFLDWHNLKRLHLNPEFQRRDVWSKSEKAFLIDTLLRNWSIPKIYFRTTVDSTTKQLIRDVVDGQQRLRAIIGFASNDFPLSSKSEELAGLYYKDLSEENKQMFLQYKLSTEQFINVDDIEITRIFARLNQYGIKLNAAELRNAEFAGEIRWAVVDLSSEWTENFKKSGILTLKQISRMLDDELIAEIFQIHTRGIQGGDAKTLRSLYSVYDKHFDDKEEIISKINSNLNIFFNEYEEYMPEIMLNRVNFIMLYAAIANANGGIPLDKEIIKDMGSGEFRLPQNEKEFELANKRILDIAFIISSEEYPEKPWEKFYTASRSAPINAKSRRTRFPVYANIFKFE